MKTTLSTVRRILEESGLSPFLEEAIEIFNPRRSTQSCTELFFPKSLLHPKNQHDDIVKGELPIVGLGPNMILINIACIEHPFSIHHGSSS